MKNLKLLIFILVVFFTFVPQLVYSETPTPVISEQLTPTPTPDDSSEKLSDINNKIKELENKLNELRSTEKTLKSQIEVIDNQIALTQLRINATESEIRELTEDINIASEKVNNLEEKIGKISEALLNRIVATYKAGSIAQSPLFIDADNFSDYFTKMSYLRIIQIQDRKLLYDTHQAQLDYENQKNIFEEKKSTVVSLQTQLAGYKAQIDQEKQAKSAVLSATQNDEENYQSLLAQARAEYEAIQGIIAGSGTESFVKDVKEGERIATIISGPSCNSSGTHLHFTVSNGGATENPFNHLKSGIEYENCSGSSCGSGDSDPFNPSGNWGWPLNSPIKMYQGYGSTWAIRYSWVGRIYSFHNGIDIQSPSLDVLAVRDGELYRGSYGGSSGCRLPYARLKHADSGLDSLYLHVYY